MRTAINVDLSPAERFEVLLKEMELLQGRFDKYDDLIFRIRGWMIAAVGALLFGAVTEADARFVLFAQVIALFFFGVEVVWRSQYWYKYVKRYRYLRDALNSGKKIETISVYDLTNKHTPKGERCERTWKWLKSCVFKIELAIFYLSLIAAAEILERYFLAGSAIPAGL